MAALALALVAAAREHSWPAGGGPIDVRVGLHAGPATSGVLGDALPKWSLFGSTVVLASRMESSGARGRVHASAAFADVLRTSRRASEFTLTPRLPRVEVKGVDGALDTCWVTTA